MGSKLAVQLAVMVETCSFSCRSCIKGAWRGGGGREAEAWVVSLVIFSPAPSPAVSGFPETDVPGTLVQPWAYFFIAFLGGLGCCGLAQLVLLLRLRAFTF